MPPIGTGISRMVGRGTKLELLLVNCFQRESSTNHCSTLVTQTITEIFEPKSSTPKVSVNGSWLNRVLRYM